MSRVWHLQRLHEGTRRRLVGLICCHSWRTGSHQLPPKSNELIYHRKDRSKALLGCSNSALVFNFTLRTRLIKRTYKSNGKTASLSTVNTLWIVLDHVSTQSCTRLYWIEQPVAVKSISYFLCNQFSSNLTNSIRWSIGEIGLFCRQFFDFLRRSSNILWKSCGYP